MNEKEKFQTILNMVNKLEIKGSENVLIMYNLISFLVNEIQSKPSISENKNLNTKEVTIDK